MEITKQIIKRYKSSTPPFFRKLSKVFKAISAVLATATASLYALPSDIVSAFPVTLLKYIGITVFFCSLIGYFISELTTEDKELSDEQYK